MKALRRIYVASAVVLVVAGLLALALLQPIFGARADFSIYNTRWNGASDLAADVYGAGAFVPAFSVSFDGDDPQVVPHSFVDLDLEPGASSILVLGPTAGPTSEEAAWLGAFVAEGGRLLVADDFGPGNSFLAAAGATTRFDGALVIGLGFTIKPEFGVATNVTPHSLTREIDELVLDHPTFLQPGASADVLAVSDASAWADRDRDEVRDAREAGGPLALLTVERVGAGTVVALADPSLLVNGMRPYGDDERLAANVVAWLAEDGRGVVLDEAHRSYPDPVRLLGTTFRAVPDSARIALALAALGLFLLFTTGVPGRIAQAPARTFRALARRLAAPPQSTVDPVARVMEKHPDWDETALRNIRLRWQEEAP